MACAAPQPTVTEFETVDHAIARVSYGVDGKLHLNGEGVVRAPIINDVEEIERFHLVGTPGVTRGDGSHGCGWSMASSLAFGEYVVESMVESNWDTCEWIVAVTPGNPGDGVISASAQGEPPCEECGEGGEGESSVYQTVTERDIPGIELAVSTTSGVFVRQIGCVTSATGGHMASIPTGNPLTTWYIISQNGGQSDFTCGVKFWGKAKFQNDDFPCPIGPKSTFFEVTKNDITIPADGGAPVFELDASDSGACSWLLWHKVSRGWGTQGGGYMSEVEGEVGTMQRVVSLPAYRNSSLVHDQTGRSYLRVGTQGVGQ